MPWSKSYSGSLSSPIYGIKNKASALVLFCKIRPNIRKTIPVALMHLELFEALGGMPVTTMVDMGSETGEVDVMSHILREAAAPQLDPTSFKILVYVQSKKNSPIEGFWTFLRLKWGDNIRSLLVSHLDTGLCNLDNSIQRVVYHWIWVPFIQSSLDQGVKYWNTHRIRYQKSKLMASGMTPRHAYATAELRGLRNCLIPLDSNAIQSYRSKLLEDLEKESSLESLWFWTDEQDLYLKNTLATLEIGEITMENAWDVFRKILNHIESTDTLE